MNNTDRFISFFYPKLLSEETMRKSESTIIRIAVASFIVHLIIIFLNDLKIIELSSFSELVKNPISAIYTPFSFILVYEVYLLVYYLPKSTSKYIGKQYEIITLILIRRIFKDLSNLQFTDNWFAVKDDLQFTYDISATIILFILLLLFYRLNEAKDFERETSSEFSLELGKFIKMKKIIAICLVPIFISLAFYSFAKWINEYFFSISLLVVKIKDINKIFFDEFFTVLILIDVLLLLYSFLHTDKFSKIIRNSSFIISTILLKLSFATEGLLNTILIVVAVSFGVIILAIHNQFENLNKPIKV